jgi:hypothetical protein
MTEAPEMPKVIADLPDGIYFDMAEEEYHAIPRLSSSGIQSIMVSPATFWAGSWLNPEKEEKEETAARTIGRAYHVARLQPELFFQLYAPELDKADLEDDCLMTDAAIKAALKDAGLPQTKEGEGVLARAYRLRDAGYPGQIWHCELAAWEHDNQGKTGIAPKVWREIMRDMKALQSNPEVSQFLTGGQAEVSVLWTDPTRGVKMKCRFDYLRPGAFTDLKTFDNSQGRHLEQAILGAFRFNRYYIQGAVYWQAFEQIRAGELQVMRSFDEGQTDLIETINRGQTFGRCFYVFQEKNGIPNVLAREYMIRDAHASLRAAAGDDDQLAESANRFGHFSKLYEKAAREIDYAMRAFLAMQEIYEPGQPWQPVNALGRIEDECFPMNFLDGDF